jgi:hypothetical protein
MTLHLQPVRVCDGHDQEGMLVFTADRTLVAVLVRLPDMSVLAPGRWCLEAGFGRLAWGGAPIFRDLAAAQAWISARLGGASG